MKQANKKKKFLAIIGNNFQWEGNQRRHTAADNTHTLATHTHTHTRARAHTHTHKSPGVRRDSPLYIAYIESGTQLEWVGRYEQETVVVKQHATHTVCIQEGDSPLAESTRWWLANSPVNFQYNVDLHGTNTSISMNYVCVCLCLC